MPCLHKNLMRHEYHGEIWWQCDEGCDFIFRQSQGEAGTPVAAKAKDVVTWFWAKQGAEGLMDADDLDQIALVNLAWKMAPIPQDGLRERVQRLHDQYERMRTGDGLPGIRIGREARIVLDLVVRELSDALAASVAKPEPPAPLGMCDNDNHRSPHILTGSCKKWMPRQQVNEPPTGERT